MPQIAKLFSRFRPVGSLVALACLPAFASESDVRFGGGHPWLSKNHRIDFVESVAVSACNANVKCRAIPHETPSRQGHYFDVVIAMHDSRSPADRECIESAITNFALGVYEATEGKHYIGTVSIYENPGCLKSDIIWYKNPKSLGGESDTGETSFDNYGKSQWIKISDKSLKNTYWAGQVLTHEWCHYMYGFMDEYRLKEGQTHTEDSPNMPHSEDIAVQNSLMASPPTSSFEDLKINCNLSFARRKNETGFQKWENTCSTAQHRIFGKSCLEQLHSPSKPLEVYDGYGLNGEPLWFTARPLSFMIPTWPEFSGIDPTKPPKINLDEQDGEKKAKSYLKIKWNPKPKHMWGICLDHSESMSGTDLENAKANAKRTIDMAPAGTMIGIFAFASSVSELVPFTEVTDANRASLKAMVNSLSSGGNTALWKAADAALNSMNAIDPEHNNIGSLILLTDGCDNASGSITRSSVVAKCLEMGVAFNSISYGNNADEELGAASSATGGRNVAATDSLASLNDAFSRLLTYGSSRMTICDEKGAVASSGTLDESFDVDSSIETLQTTVTLSVPTVSATVYVVSPTGTRYSATSTSTVGSESTFVFQRTNPVPGRWTVSVVAPVGTQVSCYADASVSKEPPRLSIRVDEEGTVVYANLSYDYPVNGAVVKALIPENGTMREIPFEPIGGGTYRLYLWDCGTFQDGFTVRADAVKGVAIYTYVGVFDYAGDGEGSPIPESFTRSEWLDLSRLNAMPIRFVSVHPRWPWEGKADIDFTVAPADSNTKVSVSLVGVDKDSSDRFMVSTVQTDDSLSDLAAGKHRVTWNAAADVPNADIANFSIRFDATTTKALEDATGVTASAGTYFNGVHVSWNKVANATHYRIYRSESSASTSTKTLLATTTAKSYVDADAVVEKKYYYYWIQPLVKKSDGSVKHEGGLAVSGGGWRGPLGAVSGLAASAGTHYDGVHLSWTGSSDATQYNIYRSTSSSASTKSLLATVTSASYVDQSAVQLQKYYYYWVEPIAVVSGTTYRGAINTSPVYGWRNKLGTPSFKLVDWQCGDKGYRPRIFLVIDGSVSGATFYQYMAGDAAEPWRWNAMAAVVAGSGSYDIYSMSPSAKKQIDWAWASRYELHVYVRAANSEGVGDWSECWSLAEHLNEPEFKNSSFYTAYPKK